MPGRLGAGRVSVCLSALKAGWEGVWKLGAVGERGPREEIGGWARGR